MIWQQRSAMRQYDCDVSALRVFRFHVCATIAARESRFGEGQGMMAGGIQHGITFARVARAGTSQGAVTIPTLKQFLFRYSQRMERDPPLQFGRTLGSISTKVVSCP